MAIQTLVPQYYDSINTNTSFITSSGTYSNYHMYINDSTNNTFLYTSGNIQSFAFGMGDILLMPKAITVDITMSGSSPFYINNETYPALFNNGGDIIANFNTTDRYYASSGRFDTYSYNLSMAYSGFDLVELENSILKLNIAPSAGDSLSARISKIQMTVSGDPLYDNTCYFFIPGNVKNRILEHYSHQANPHTNSPTKTHWLFRGNFNDSNFNLGHYFLDEGSGNVIYSSGTTASGIFESYSNGHIAPPTSKAWYNYYNNNQFNDTYNHIVDVNHYNTTRQDTYLSLGNITPTGDFTLFMRFMPSGERSNYSGTGTGYKNRCLFSAGDIRVDTTINSDNINFRVGSAYLPIDFFRFYDQNEVHSFIMTYANNTLNVYGDQNGNFYNYGSTTGSRTSLSGLVVVGAYTYPWYSSGFAVYDMNYYSFGLAELGLANYAFSENAITNAFSDSIIDFYDYLDEDIHPSADYTYIENKLLDASGEFTHKIFLYPSAVPNDFYNLNTPFQFNEDLVSPSAVFLRVGITSNTTNPSGLNIGGYFHFTEDLTGLGENKITLFNRNIPSGYFQDFIILSGYYNKLSISGFYYNDPYRYIKANELQADSYERAELNITYPSSPRYTANTKIHSVQFNYDGWFIPDTGTNYFPLYISGSPIKSNDIDLFIEGSENNDDVDLFIRGLLPYSGETTLFTTGGIALKSCDLYTKGEIPISGDTTLFIRGQVESDNMPLYLHQEYFTDSGNIDFNIWGYSGSGLMDSISLFMRANVSEDMSIYLHNEDVSDNTANMNLVMFGKQVLNGYTTASMYIANSGSEIDNDFTMYLSTDRFIDYSANVPFYIARPYSNESNFTTMFIANSGFGNNHTMYVNGAYTENNEITLFMPSSITSIDNNIRLYSHGY